jgi:protein-S-isoprenylcysteine O-methyltransferase Ste14
VLAPPPLVFLIPLVVGLLLHRIRARPILPPPLARLVGWPLLLGGIVLNVWMVRTMRQSQTPIDPRKSVRRLVTTGPFTLTRNPSYTAFALAYVGIAFLRNTRWPFVFLPAVISIMERGVIEREEAYLERRFGPEYQRYRARVRRWL